MRLESVLTDVSPDDSHSLRTTAIISSATESTVSLWVEYPPELAEGTSQSANPWVVAMLPAAATRAEHVFADLPVDPVLHENLRGVSATWSLWYPQLGQAQINAPYSSCRSEKGSRTGTFFSGGVDSFFSIARRLPGNSFGIPAVGSLDDLVTVWGFDVGVNDVESFKPLAAALNEAAQAIGRPHWIVRTNLRQVLAEFRRNWGPLTFGAGLAFIALFFERRFSEFVIGSSYPFGALVPWGSHPLVDPLFSSSSLRVVHDGAPFGRLEKTRTIGRWPLTGRFLHVCQGSGPTNCSACEKCLRTMATIDVLGLKERYAHSFDWRHYGPHEVSSLFVGAGPGTTFYKEIIDEAQRVGREDISRAVNTAIRRSRRLAPLMSACHVMLKVPLIYRLGLYGEAQILRGMRSARYIDHSQSSKNRE